MEIITQSVKETKDFGREFSTRLTGGEVIALSGDLGSGKTTFVQGLAEGLGVERIISPTFILMRSYKGEKDLYHLDLYRLEGNVSQELESLGVSDFWEKKENVVLIEWAEKAREILPKDTIWIKFEYIDDEKRRIILE